MVLQAHHSSAHPSSSGIPSSLADRPFIRRVFAPFFNYFERKALEDRREKFRQSFYSDVHPSRHRYLTWAEPKTCHEVEAHIILTEYASNSRAAVYDVDLLLLVGAVSSVLNVRDVTIRLLEAESGLDVYTSKLLRTLNFIEYRFGGSLDHSTLPINFQSVASFLPATESELKEIQSIQDDQNMFGWLPNICDSPLFIATANAEPVTSLPPFPPHFEFSMHYSTVMATVSDCYQHLLKKPTRYFQAARNP